MAVRLVLDPASVGEVTDYLRTARERILRAIREGMRDAMEGLAAKAVETSTAAGIQKRSGDLIDAILGSPKVTETYVFIRGTVSSEVGGKHLGLWLEEGTHVPAVQGKLFGFTTPDGNTVFARGHRAFDMKPHPFLNPALRDYETTISEIIQGAVDAAISSEGTIAA